MTVKELKAKIAAMDDDARVVACLETDSDTTIFEIDDISSHRGTPRRGETGEAGFAVDPQGPVKWTFIHLEEA